MSPNHPQWRILCIDDDPDVLEILSATLGMEHEVVTAVDGLEAISMLDFCDADFIICDVMMPHMNGYQTVEAIRRHPEYMDVPVFFLTAETSRESAQKGFVSGANLYLTKPFDPMRVLDNINHFLQNLEREPRRKRFTSEEVQQQLGKLGEAASESAEGAVSGALPRIIVLTSDEGQTECCRRALEKGYECVCCADPLESLQQLFRYEPDLLVVNPFIPNLSGLGLAQMIRGNPRLRKLPIVLMHDREQEIDPRLVASITRHPILDAHATEHDVRNTIEDITRSPGFQPRRKHATIEELRAEEQKVRERVEMERETQTTQAERKRKRYQAIQEFIDRNIR